MISERKLRRFQWALGVAGVALLAFYWFAYRSLAGWAHEADKPVLETWRKLVTSAQRNPNIRSLDESALKAGVRQMDEAAAHLQQAGQFAWSRLGLDSEIQHRLREEFQLLEFEQARMQIAADLRRAAAQKKIVLTERAVQGLPSFDEEQPQASLLWPQLDFARQLLDSAIAAQPRAISNLSVLPPVTRAGGEGRQPLYEFPMRIEVVGSPDCLARFLTSLPLRGNELTTAGMAGLTNKTQAMFAGRFLLKNSSAVPNESTLEMLVTGFCEPARSEVAR